LAFTRTRPGEDLNSRARSRKRITYYYCGFREKETARAEKNRLCWKNCTRVIHNTRTHRDDFVARNLFFDYKRDITIMLCNINSYTIRVILCTLCVHTHIQALKYTCTNISFFCASRLIIFRLLQNTATTAELGKTLLENIQIYTPSYARRHTAPTETHSCGRNTLVENDFFSLFHLWNVRCEIVWKKKNSRTREKSRTKHHRDVGPDPHTPLYVYSQVLAVPFKRDRPSKELRPNFFGKSTHTIWTRLWTPIASVQRLARLFFILLKKIFGSATYI